MLRTNPNHVDRFTIEGYEDIGWANGFDTRITRNEDGTYNYDYSKTPEKYQKHINQGHNKTRNTREHDNSHYSNRGTDVISICDDCKIFYHTDMSD